MSSKFSFKELYDVVLKATSNMTIGSRQYLDGEIVLAFDRIQIANINEVEDNNFARGGFDNRTHIVWQHIKEVQLVLAQGVFSKHQFSLMNNSKVVDSLKPFVLTKREVLESDENNIIHLSELPYSGAPIFVKDTNGNKLGGTLTGTDIEIETPYKEVIAEYSYEYSSGTKTVMIGQNQINGFLFLEGKTRVKDDIDGHIKTGIIRIPKLRLMSDLSITLGDNANPVVGYMRANGYPIGEKGNTRAMEIIFLNDDIDSDM